MKYAVLAQTFEQLSSTNSRLKKTEILAHFFPKLNDNDIDAAILLLQGRVFPEWDVRTSGVAGKLVLRAIARATGHDQIDVEKMLKKTGDIGQVAENLTIKRRQQTLFSQPLELQDVFDTLQKLASLEGNKSQDVKLAELSRLLTSASPLEAKFIVRTVIEDLRIGIADGTIRDAIAAAWSYGFFAKDFKYDSNVLEHEMQPGFNILKVKEQIKRALDLTADFSVVFAHIKAGKSLEDFKLTLGKPCRVMLARKENSFDEAFARTNFPVRLEYKYDGFRMQVHKAGNVVKLFTRRLEEVTTQFPDIVDAVKELVLPKQCIVDTEVVGYDPKTGKYQPFQHISKRIRRKYDIAGLAQVLPVELNIFDVLLLNGEIQIEKPLHERLKLLPTIIQKEVARKIVLVKGVVIDKLEDAQEFYDESLAAGNEGIMIKDLTAPYQPGGRVSAWIKMKPIMDELDLVVVEAEWGSGKRSEWMTSFTLACRTAQGTLLQMGKVGTGLKELPDGEHVTFSQVTELLKPLTMVTEGKIAKVRPKVVLMVAYEEIQKSPSYSSGYALRFPRVLRLRPDRSIDDIASIDDVQDLYESQ
ncbi:ATP-dependent DNA ligase [Candidatus Woesearchaeota archaeon]|nr:ATP-dependent DNA ligase [Candidatus Woesearchaeota archaeon]